MIRLFQNHNIREVQELDGMWDFHMNGFSGDYRMPVPSCWEQHPDFLSHRGKGVYEREIYVKRDTNLRLEFKGVSHTADVYFDGEKTAHHYNAFTPFDTVICNVKKGTHKITVAVDNTFSDASALHIPNDYYTYGGITRPVSMEYVSGVYIKSVHFTPKRENGAWSVEIKVTVKNADNSDKQIIIQSALCEGEMTAVTPVKASGEASVVFKSFFEDVIPWSPENPSLYMLCTTLFENGVPTDDLIERVGFREIEIRDTKIYLNGEKIYLKGFNRHEDYAVDGCAVSLAHMVQDLDLMRDMNANAVRTCHYPNDERFLDLCDERGIMVWEENHARGLSIENMQNPNFERQCADCIYEMIENHYNHPSILIWGILNECASETEEGRRMYKAQYEQIRSMDTTRPVTSATCRHFTDICLDMPDIVSFNMYSGWYQDCGVKQRSDDEIDWTKRSGGDNKPIIVSEVGAAAMYGYRSRAREKWSEERQSDIIRENLEVYMTDGRISGVFIWQLADCRVTEDGGWFASRARCHNNKGVLDEYRRPKIAYDTVKELFERYGY